MSSDRPGSRAVSGLICSSLQCGIQPWDCKQCDSGSCVLSGVGAWRHMDIMDCTCMAFQRHRPLHHQESRWRSSRRRTSFALLTSRYISPDTEECAEGRCNEGLTVRTEVSHRWIIEALGSCSVLVSLKSRPFYLMMISESKHGEHRQADTLRRSPTRHLPVSYKPDIDVATSS